MPRSKLAVLVLVTAAGSCGTGGGAVKPDEMSAAQHRDEAARENEAARQHAKDYNPRATAVSSFRPAGGAPSDDYLFPLSVYNPTEGELRRADQHRAHARQHEKAARALEHFEDAECRGFPPVTRAACPLLRPVRRIDDIAGGIRVTFGPKTPVNAVLAHMRCHYAYARARAFEDAVSCPLYVRGIEIKRATDPLAIEITTADWQRVDDLRVRSREEAVFAVGGGQ
jgi:hypothetical protein